MNTSGKGAVRTDADKKHVLEVLMRLTDRLGVAFGRELSRVVLFGSFATGTHHAESDVDVVVVLTDEGKRLYDERGSAARYGFTEAEIAVATESRYPFSILVWSESRYEKEIASGSSFGKNLAENGVDVMKFLDNGCETL